MGACRGLNCHSADLIRAHIIPRASGRQIRGRGRNISLSIDATRRAFPQLGEYDDAILCRDCDNKLGTYDRYAIEFCRSFPVRQRDVGAEAFEVDDFDGDRFAKFVLAILWRASISSRTPFSEIALGKYEAMAQEILFGARDLGSLRALRVFLQRYRSKDIDPAGFYTLPIRMRIRSLNCYVFALSGFRVLAILDSRSMWTDWAPYLVGGAHTLRGRFTTFENTFEFRWLTSTVIAEARRQGRPPWELRTP